jgi:phage anti-repressor protein
MKELIKITTTPDNVQVVSGRELHAFLQNTDNVNTWFKRQSERAMLIENEDWQSLAILQPSGQTANDYAITLSAAKEIAMLNGGDKGKEARMYFIECERQLNKPKSQIDIILDIAMYIKEQDTRLQGVEKQLQAIETSKAVAMKELQAIELSTEPVPEIGIRLRISQIVRVYADKTNISHRDIWNSMYRKMLYAYHFNVNAYKKLKKSESKMDIVERCNQLDNLYALVSKELIIKP